MILVAIAVWILVGFASSFEVIEIYKKRKVYEEWPWNILTKPKDVTLIIGTILGFITLLPVLEYKYYTWIAKRRLKKLDKSFRSKKFQGILNKIPEEDSQMLRDSIEQLQKEMSEYEDKKR